MNSIKEGPLTLSVSPILEELAYVFHCSIINYPSYFIQQPAPIISQRAPLGNSLSPSVYVCSQRSFEALSWETSGASLFCLKTKVSIGGGGDFSLAQ